MEKTDPRSLARFRNGRRTVRNPPLAPRELATVLLRLCALGAARRVRGSCLGTRLIERIEVADGTVRLIPPSGPLQMQTQRRRARRHALRGHDPGCEAIGVSLRETEALLRRFDGFDAAALFMEAFHDAVGEILGLAGSLDESGLVEVVDVHLGRRITPVPLPFL